MTIQRIYHHYELWEDYKAGLYKTPSKDIDEARLFVESADLLSCQELFYETALQVIREWKHATEVNLSNISRNRQAWLGQASCCYACGSPEYVTKQAWHFLSPQQQIEANATADRVISHWESLQQNA